MVCCYYLLDLNEVNSTPVLKRINSVNIDQVVKIVSTYTAKIIQFVSSKKMIAQRLIHQKAKLNVLIK